MEVRVDSSLIRSERENRGWTQDHLATVSGLSLRTIQRIEKTGTASLESVTALASVLSAEVAELRAGEPVPSRKRGIRLSLELPARIALAVVSGVLCALLFRRTVDAGWFEYGWLNYGIGGALFSLTVLCPYLSPGHALLKRALALICASTLSYFCAVMIVLNGDAWFPVAPVLISFLLASVVGVTIVLLAAKFLIPLRVTAAFWFLGLAASLLGGAAMYSGSEVFGDTTLSTIVSYCCWHVLTCVAIYRGHQPNDARRGLLAAFVRARGRFSIVPGWMNLSHATLSRQYGAGGPGVVIVT